MTRHLVCDCGNTDTETVADVTAPLPLCSAFCGRTMRVRPIWEQGVPMPVRAAQAHTEAVDHPLHYGGADNPYEAIKVIEAWDLDFCLGNTLKYIARAGKKRDVAALEDLRKARWYLDRAIQHEEAL